MKALAALLISMAMVACAMTGPQQMSAAKIIARNAGYYVAMNNPEAAVAVAVAYQDIEKYQGEQYKASVASGLKWMLDQNNVKGSDKLAKDAESLLRIFGVPLPEPAAVSTDRLMQFDEPAIREVSGAFIEGMGQ